MLTVAVLISGSGSNLRALLDAAAAPDFPARVIVVGADREADGFAHAEAYDIPTFLVPWSAFDSREAWAEELDAQLRAWQPDLVVLSGFMRLLPTSFVAAWSPRILNTHPAYLPEFPGAHGVRDALAAGATRTGASVIVVDPGVDSGPIVAQERIDVLPGDDERSLHERIKIVERRLLIDVVRGVATGELDLAAIAGAPHPAPSAPAPSTSAPSDTSAPAP
ncbi:MULTISPECIES: phosphoribosylglycinamide formyltransferase [Microbacterium]|uniref:Phosphoribosylglycinamide formyltransferase n=1 Tax=Microbacterium wangchenii TaxID=2541726 RepID=A0ABX5SP61_9MICO|nr:MULTISPECIES: phosphoribosylglycinamide formyltransferase [Microbacterium]MCK6066599.1 phosphoribosylglycinamide formyltransferase [Microbacterium sp. EYE_512]QBR87933.1 phosphoribosylglycinamide formyltransferase [Microbacterium wangchenii]TFV83944.1 phosphoribosylglycinamide formyltransferase [Microbacterium sp. dk485]TXK18277.1 phosphoribosylglycinamide formyltransferase [Microbacterium wangchenii]